MTSTLIRARFLLTALVTVTATMPGMAQLKKQEIPGLPNYSRLEAATGFGGQVEPEGMARLKKEGFVSVITLRRETETGANIDALRTAAKAAGLKFIHISVHPTTPDAKMVAEFLAAVADKTNQPAYIYSGSGNRVGSMWMIKRVLQDKWTIEKALAEAKEIGLISQTLTTFATDYIETHK